MASAVTDASEIVVSAYGRMTDAVNEYRNAVLGLAADALAAQLGLAAMGDAAVTAAAKTDAAATATAGAGRRWWGVWGFLTGRQISLFGGLAAVGALHLLVDGVAEFLAVIIPATIALVAFGAAAAPTLQDLYNHFNNVNIVSQAMGRNLLPLPGTFSQLSDAVKPQVYDLLGQALEVINSKMGEFSQLAIGAGSAIDQLASRASVALQSSGMSQFLKNATSDLAGIGDVIGNVFGIIGNLLKTLPGYAQALLGILQGVTHALETITGSGIVQGLLKVGLSFHGIWLYGGLAATALLALRGPVVGLAGGALSLATRFGFMGESALQVASAIGVAEPGIIRIGTNIAAATENAGFFARNMGVAAGDTGLLAGAAGLLDAIPVWGWVAAGVGALVGLVLWLGRSKDATTQWADSLQNVINQQSSFTGVIGATQMAIGKVDVALRGAQSAYHNAATGANSFGASQFQLSQQAAAYAQKVNDLKAAGSSYSASLTLEQNRLEVLREKFGSVSQAQGIFNALHLKSIDIQKASAAQWASDIQQMQAYQTALKAVAYASGAAGANERVLDYLISDQYTNVSQLNQAWNTYTQLQMSGDSALLNVTTTLGQLGTAAGKAHASFTGLSANSITLRTDFGQLQGGVQQIIDSLRYTTIPMRELANIVATEYAPAVHDGALQNDAYRTSIDLAAQQAGYMGKDAIGPLTNFINDNKVSASLAANMIDEYSGKMNDGAKAASNFSSVLLNELNVQVSQFMLKTDGAVGEAEKYTSMIRNNTANTAAGRSVRAQLIRDLENAGLSAKQAKAYVDGLNKSIDHTHSKYFTITGRGTGVYSISSTAGGEALQHHQRSGPGIPGKLHTVASGGIVTGGIPGRDSVHLLAMPGEAVLNTRAVRALGEHTVHALNKMAESGALGTVHRMAAGGIVGGNASSSIGRLANLPPDLSNALETAMVRSMISAMNAAERAAQQAAVGAGGGKTSAGGQYNRSMLERLWESAGGPGGSTALIAAAIALAESGGNPNARNPSGASGLWQILGQVVGGNIFSPMINALNAVTKYHMAGGFSPWVTFESGAYRQFLDQGGWLKPGWSNVYNGTGKPERVVGPNEELVIQNHIYLDGRQIATSTQRELRQYNRRNGGRGSNKALIPGG